jgi:hypothetical protein
MGIVEIILEDFIKFFAWAGILFIIMYFITEV